MPRAQVVSCIVNNNFIYMNFYNISQTPERIQTAQHFHSSLQQPNLDNVQAQLFVARQRNYQLAQQYFQNKYGSGQIYDKYIETHNLQGLGPPQQPAYDLKRQLEKKALEIQQQQTRKIQQRKAFRQSGQPRQNKSGDYKIANKRNNQRPNIWSPKNQHEEQPIIQKQTNNSRPFQINPNQEKQSNFINDFKNYLSNKKKLKEEQQVSKAYPTQTVTSQFRQSGLSPSPSKKDQNKKQEKCYEEQLVKKMFRDISGKTDKTARIQKIQLIQYLNANKKILKVLGTTPEEVSRSVMALTCKDSNLLSPAEGLIWVYICLGKTEEVKRLKAQQQFQQVPSGCMLSKELMQLFQDTYRHMDRHNDLIIKRVPFIGRLTSQPLVKKSLNLPAVFEPEYNRHVSLRRIFERIEIQTLLCGEEDRRINQYISWNQFINYFQSGHKQRGKYDLIVLVESLKNQQKFGFSSLPESVSQIISSIFKKLDKGEEMFNTLEVINQIKLHQDYEIQKYTFIKQSGDDGEGLSQTFDDVLVRIKDTGLKFVNPKEFLQYFSERGKPIQEFQIDRKNQQSKIFSPTKVSYIQNQMFPKAEQPNGYDSDPEFYNNSKLQQPLLDARKSQKQFKKFKQTSQSFVQPQGKTNQFRLSSSNQLKVTLPQPFSFQQREKQKQMEKSQQKSLQPILQKKQFKAKGVPSKVAQIGLYQKMLSQQQKKNQQRKRSSMIMTLANERPFSFINRKTDKKTKQQRQQFIFKAKPIPWFCSVDLLARKKEQQILRNQRIAKTAQQKLAKAKLPPRMQKDYLQKQANKALSPSNKPRQSQSVIKVKQPPKFQKIHKQFEQALQRKRKQNKTTQIKQFKFSSTAKDSISKIKQQQGDIEQYKIQRVQPPIIKSNVDIFAQSTTKFTQQVERRRQQLEEKRKKEEKIKREEQERQKIDQQLKKKVQEAAKKNKQNKQIQDQQAIKLKNAKLQANFKEWKQERIQNGRKQPLLVDRVSKRDQKIQKMKRLWQISQTLIKNGIKGKQHDHYFKREQLLLIKDYQEFKDKIQGKEKPQRKQKPPKEKI